MSEVDKRIESLLEVSENHNFQVTALSKQMGINTSAIKRHEVEITGLKEDFSSFKEIYEQDKEIAKQNEYISPAERQELADALTNRVTDICKSHDCFNLFGEFKRKGWADSKKYANVVGTGGVYTKKLHFRDAIDYIGTWQPHGYGVTGYIEHLKNRKK